MEGLFKLFAYFGIFLSVLFYNFIYQDVTLLDYCEYRSKPIIYGEEFCKNILEKKVIVTQNYFQKIINLISSKVFLQGKFDNQSVVFKTTASTNDIEKVEHDFSRIFEKLLMVDFLDIFLFVKLQIRTFINIPVGTSLVPKLRLCPYNSNTENFFKKIPGSNEFKVEDYLQLWTILKSNPEPLILKILDSRIWPVPQYFGSCGRLIVVEDCGLTLTHYFDYDWKVRANITYQLLENAMKFTFGDPDFAYYLTDLSPDNIAVTQAGIVKYIDLEHVIMVDKNTAGEDIGSSRSWHHNHTTKHYDCPDCVIFEADEICTHHISDHNVYAVCKEILSDSELLPGGFLHSDNISQVHIINQFVQDCLEPKESHRFETAEKIMSLLRRFLLKKF